MTRWPFASRTSCVLALLWLATASVAQGPAQLTVAPAPPPVLDGRIDAAEWEPAARFTIATRGGEMGQGFLMRAERQLHVAFRSKIGPNAVGLRFTFTDPEDEGEVSVLVAALNPPHPPLAVFGSRAGDPPRHLDASRCDVRFSFAESGSGFECEMRLPLDLLEIARSDGRQLFRAGLWALGANRPIAAFPVVAGTGPMMRRGFAALVPVKDWGAGVGTQEIVFEPQPALRLLARVEDERVAGPEADEPNDAVLLAYLGVGDGRRRDAPLAALEAELHDLIEKYPDYFALREVLVRVLTGRNRLKEALEVTDRMERDFPAVTKSVTHVLLRSQLLRDLGRFDEAVAELERDPRMVELFPELTGIRIGLTRLQRAWELEQRMQAEDATRDDLPRVRLITSKGPILIELFEEDAPNAVANFISLVESGFYSGTRFHWVERAAQAIGGDPKGDGSGDPGYLIESDPGRRAHLPFSISFVDKRGEFRTEGGAFSLHIAPAPAFDGRTTVFGRVIEGQETVLLLEYDDSIKSASVVRKRDHAYAPIKRAKPAE